MPFNFYRYGILQILRFPTRLILLVFSMIGILMKEIIGGICLRFLWRLNLIMPLTIHLSQIHGMVKKG